MQRSAHYVRVAVFTLLALTTLFSAAQLAHAQFETATVLGTITDLNSEAVQNAEVTLKNIETGVTTSAQTDEDGNYQFTNVRIGTYNVTAEAPNFTTAIAENVQVVVNARRRVDLALQAGSVSETIVVTDAAPLLETESSERGQVITREQIVNLPLNGRNYADLALLVPGVRKSLLNNPGAGGRDASFNVNGLRSSLNNFILDGVDNNSYGTSNQGFSNQVVQPSPDAVAEFKVQTNNYSAEFGRAGGAVINTSIRSGTNRFNGSIYNFTRNTAFNAIGFFKPQSGEKPVLIQNQFGGTFGGPIIRDRIFFFLDYEGFRRITKEVRFATLPTLAQRQGALGVPVRNPYTNEVFAGGVIPQEQITSFARRVLADLPAPNLPGTSNNFQSLPRSEFFNDKGDVKLDFNIGARTTAFVRGSMRKVNNFEAPTLLGPSGGDNNSNVRVLNQQLAGGFTYTLTPTSLFEFRLGISRTEAGKTPYILGSASIRELYGITGLPDTEGIAGGLNTQSISGYPNFGRQSSNPQYQNPTVINPRLNYSFLVGRHSLKTGYEYQHINTEIEDFHPKYGQDSYGGQFSRPTNITTSNNLYNLADFLFGARSQYALANVFVANYRQRMHFAYVQDDFTFSPKLTLNLGLRYEFATPQYERNNQLSNFDPATNTLIRATDGSLASRALVNPDKDNFAPRLGFAYNVLSRTVLRSAYGISYVHFNRLGGENILAFNGPQVFSATIRNEASRLANICTGNDYRNCFRPTQAGYPTGLVDSANYSTATARVNYTPRDTPTAYVQSFHASVQHEIVRDLLVDVAYVGNRSRNLIILGDYNQLVPNELGVYPTTGSLADRRPVRGFDFIQISFAGGRASYDALQLKLERRFTRGIYLLNSFTFSKALDNASGHLETSFGDNSRANLRDLAGEKGLSSYDQPVNNTTSLVYDLPFGRRRRFGTNIPRALDAVLGGFRLSLINTITSGQAANLTYNASSAAQVGSSLTYRPNVIGELVVPESERTRTNYLNRAAVAIPTANQPFGNAGRNTVRGPAFWQTDLGLHKSFNLFNENTRLEVRAETFNLFNRTNFTAPDTNASNISRNSAGEITGGSFGTINSAFPARELQFAVKLYF